MTNTKTRPGRPREPSAPGTRSNAISPCLYGRNPQTLNTEAMKQNKHVTFETERQFTAAATALFIDHRPLPDVLRSADYFLEAAECTLDSEEAVYVIGAVRELIDVARDRISKVQTVIDGAYSEFTGFSLSDQDSEAVTNKKPA